MMNKSISKIIRETAKQLFNIFIMLQGFVQLFFSDEAQTLINSSVLYFLVFSILFREKSKFIVYL